MGWVTATALGLLGLLTLGAIVLVGRQVQASFREIEREMASHRAAWAEQQTRIEALLAHEQAKQQETESLWLGAFLPTDAAQADLEQRVRQAEDHAIQAGRPERSWPNASQPSGARPASRRAPRPSGSG